MAEVYAGTIGGVNFNEYAGSVEINVGKEQKQPPEGFK